MSELTRSQGAREIRARGRRRILRIGAAILLPVVVLLIIEISLRIAGVGFSTNLLVPCTVKGSPASCYNLFFATPYFPAGMVQTPRLYSIPATKSPGTYRIFVLGESAAMGDPDSAYGFDLDQQVPANSPLLQQAYANYERNLRDTITLLRMPARG